MAHTEEMTQALLPLTLEVSTDHVADFVSTSYHLHILLRYNVLLIAP
jgi:hypothetical protein